MLKSLLTAAGLAATLTLAPAAAAPADAVCGSCVAATMQALAGEDFHGRKCGTADENAASVYLADRLKAEGIAPGAPGGGYLQKVELDTPTYASPPTLDITGPKGETRRLTVGADMAGFSLPAAFQAPLVRITVHEPPSAEVQGRVVIYDVPDDGDFNKLFREGAAAVILRAGPEVSDKAWAQMIAQPRARPIVVDGVPRAARGGPVVRVRPETFAGLEAFDGGQAKLAAPFGAPVVRITYNVIGVRHGTASDADRQAVLLTAHYDHLGVRGGVTYHGADDDASGTSAVMEFARILGRDKPHRRTVYFALFGCEEEGGLGARYFLNHTPVPTADIATNLEFEMIGVDDPKRPGFLMMTGWDRSNLGPTLAAHGARVGPDPYPAEHFFQRSDNYQLALQGVVAQTISAWPIPPTYHSPTDDLAHVDEGFMDKVIGSLVQPVRWLLDSDFKPAWTETGRPSD